MTADPSLAQNSFDIEDSDDILGLAKSLVNGRHPGILGTVDGSGWPKMRWMSTLSFDEFPVFHTLTAPGSRKVVEIQDQPAVTWLFFNDDKTLILNLRGRATILRETSRIKKVWGKIVDTSHAYFLNQYQKKPGFVVIETVVEAIECISPVNALKFSVDPAGFIMPAHPYATRNDV